MAGWAGKACMNGSVDKPFVRSTKCLVILSRLLTVLPNINVTSTTTTEFGEGRRHCLIGTCWIFCMQ
jgi:hypothetical protein